MLTSAQRTHITVTADRRGGHVQTVWAPSPVRVRRATTWPQTGELVTVIGERERERNHKE